jgi:hypothetical protein
VHGRVRWRCVAAVASIAPAVAPTVAFIAFIAPIAPVVAAATISRNFGSGGKSGRRCLGANKHAVVAVLAARW